MYKVENKVTIIGAGFVGATAAFSLIHQNVVEEIALIDLNQKLAESQVMDLQHALPQVGYCKVKVGTYNDIKDSAVVVITCGCAQKPGETRMDLIKKNSCIVRSIVPEVFKQNPKAILIMVTNPVDVLTRIALAMFPKKQKQIFGSGTVLDSMRLKFLLGEYLNIDPKSIHAYIAGEHGDSEFPLWSSATIGGELVVNLPKYGEAAFAKLADKAKNAAYTIIEGKQATYYAIGAGIAQIVNSVVLNKNTVLPLSHVLDSYYGTGDVCLSMPAVVGAEGIVSTLHLKLSPQEKKQLANSVKILDQAYKLTKNY